ncbi:MAG: TerC/Alx family metal homeostasis membrane protein, partial [Bryobacteraceae bacterium]
MNIPLFPLSEYWWFYLGFTGLVLVLLALDLGLFHRKAHAVSFREASMWCIVWVTIAGLFAVALRQYSGWKFHNDPRLLAAGLDASRAARNVVLEFVTGYVVELSLSVDNIFVFVLVFRYFAIPPQYQHRVLFYGILGALIFRGIFIAVGAALIRYHWVSVVFGVFLVITGVKLAFSGDGQIEPEKNPLLRLFARRVAISPSLHGASFWVQLNGRSYATPLLVAVIFMELTDIMFAIDSVPAIFAITREPLIVFTSNVFAILGLRSMYFLLAGAVEKFFLLKYGLALVLVFVGLKMAWLNSLFGGKFPIGISLAII